MMYVQAPDVLPLSRTRPTIFLAGGITGCEDWQTKVVDRLRPDAPITLVNPRRAGQFNPEDERPQIEWEYWHLQRADGILFWFPPETLCPIALYELGRWSAAKTPLLVGVHADYRRRSDVEIQHGLVRPGERVIVGWDELMKELPVWIDRIRWNHVDG